MPLYNAAQWLEASVHSILAQTLTDFELILCDNASSDASGAICERLAAADPRIRYYRHASNIGANRNYQATLDHATGTYFKWASSSDLCAPGFLAECVAELDADPDAVLAIGRTILFSESPEDGLPYDADIALLSVDPAQRFADLFSRMQLNNAVNGVIRLEPLRAVGELGSHEAADIVLMAALALRGKFLLLDAPHFYRRMTKQTATKLKDALQAQQHIVPGARKPLLWQNWLFCLGLLHAPFGAALSARNRLRVFGHAMRRTLWARSDLVGDVMQAMRRMV